MGVYIFKNSLIAIRARLCLVPQGDGRGAAERERKGGGGCLAQAG